MDNGDLVLSICTFDKYVSSYDFDVNTPKPGKIYIIRDIQMFAGEKTVLLEEVHNQKTNTIYGNMEIRFHANCFSVIPQADIDELKQILNNENNNR